MNTRSMSKLLWRFLNQPLFGDAPPIPARLRPPPFRGNSPLSGALYVAAEEPFAPAHPGSQEKSKAVAAAPKAGEPACEQEAPSPASGFLSAARGGDAAPACDAQAAAKRLEDSSKTAPTGKPPARLTAQPSSSPSANVFLVSSWLLHDCFKLLTRTPDEDVHFVAGPWIPCHTPRGWAFLLEHTVFFDLARSSALGAVGDLHSSMRALIKIEDFGQRLTAHFHSHPGLGPEATFPSSTDLRFQTSLEKGGFTTIGAIFSRDGLVRFFSAQLAFRVHVFGSRFRRIDRHVYQLEDQK